MSEDIDRLRSFLEGECTKRHERTNQEIRVLKKRLDTQDESLRRIREVLAEMFGTPDGGDGHVGRMQDDIGGLKEDRATMERRLAKLEHIYSRILITCGLGAGAAALTWRVVERLLIAGG